MKDKRKIEEVLLAQAIEARKAVVKRFEEVDNVINEINHKMTIKRERLLAHRQDKIPMNPTEIKNWNKFMKYNEAKLISKNLLKDYLSKMIEAKDANILYLNNKLKVGNDTLNDGE